LYIDYKAPGVLISAAERYLDNHKNESSDIKNTNIDTDTILRAYIKGMVNLYLRIQKY
jgi:hypothetical protein